MSSFDNCNNITEIPENLFKNCINAISFSKTFFNCKNITSIPENLFANNPYITYVEGLFMNCNHLSSIPQSIINKCISIPAHFAAFLVAHQHQTTVHYLQD